MLTFKNSNYILFGGLLTLNILQFTIGVSGWWYLALGLVYITLISIGSSRVNSQFHFKVSCKATNTDGVILSFDDGPAPDTTPLLLDVLKHKGVKAIFFVVGKQAEKYPELIRRMLAEGHVIGNHTYSHSHYFDLFAPYVMARELRKTREIIFGISGLKINWFRPPFGVTNPMMTRALKLEPHHPVGWSVRSLDTVIKNEEKLLHRMENAQAGDIILMHDTLKESPLITEKIIEILSSRQIKFGDPAHMIPQRPYLENNNDQKDQVL